MGGAITGVKSMFGVYDPKLSGSTVSNPNGPAQIANPEEQAARNAAIEAAWRQQQQTQQENSHNGAQGFLGSMLSHQPWNGAIQDGVARGPARPPPPPQWGYQPGQGVTWQEPHRVLHGGGSDPNWAFSPSNGPFTGNRI